MDALSRFNGGMFLQGILAALVEATAIIAVLFFVQGRKFVLRDFIMGAIILAVVLLVLDIFSPTAGDWLRKGAGFGLGAMQVGFGL